MSVGARGVDTDKRIASPQICVCPATSRQRPAWNVSCLLGNLLILYACWLGMMTIHECGHVLGTWISGGKSHRVVIPLIGFSRTDARINPHPLIEVWAGPLFGWLAPYGVLIGMRIARHKLSGLIRFFAGFCAVANGAYIGAGVFIPVGDAAVMKRLGTPIWVLALFGIAALSAGLWEWHLLGKRPVSRTV